MVNQKMSTTMRRIPVFCRRNFSHICTTSLYIVVAFVCSQLDLVFATGPENGATPPAPAAPGTTAVSPSKAQAPPAPNGNNTSSHDDDGDSQYNFGGVMYDKSMLKRSFYVLIGFTCLALVFFAVRWFRSRGKRKSKKYGVLATRSSDLELRPLDQEDDEEDMTVFDVNSH